MKIVCQPVSGTQKLCGKQEERNVPYRWTKHLLSILCEDGHLFFHTLTGELLLLTEEEIAHPSSEQFRQKLIEKWFLVPEEFDENQYARQMLRIAQLVSQKRHYIKGFVIFPTTDCNARCFYCYEMGRKRIDMTEETAHDVANFMAEKCKGNPISINWFGGEPLCNTKVIDIISRELNEKGIQFKSHMTSNGYFFDKYIIERAKKLWNLEYVQITLDGTKEVYQRIKAYINDDGNAFDRVLNNIDGLLEKEIDVLIRLNMDSQNAEDLMALSDILGERFQGRSGVYIYPILIRPFAGHIHEFENEDIALEQFLAVKDRLSHWGFHDVKQDELNRELWGNHCMADTDGGVCITPDGSLSKCEHYFDSELIGSIYSDQRDTARIQEWKERVYYPECENCPLYPRCIRLKKCDWEKDGCLNYRKRMRISDLKSKMLEAYKQWR